jgi:hypothetical protein
MSLDRSPSWPIARAIGPAKEGQVVVSVVHHPMQVATTPDPSFGGAPERSVAQEGRQQATNNHRLKNDPLIPSDRTQHRTL